MSYFSQKDFEAFAAGDIGRLRLEWVACAGRIFTALEDEELRRRLEDFLRMYAAKWKTPSYERPKLLPGDTRYSEMAENAGNPAYTIGLELKRPD